jgi:alkylated DNA repair dioxygenase AlkB
MIDLYKNGLVLIPNFLNATEEAFILSNIIPSVPIHKTTRNSIKRYGSNIPYKNQLESDIIPEYLEVISDKIVSHGLLETKPNSVSINEYLIGNAIAPHVDSIESGPVITIVSLISDAIMEFMLNDHKIQVNIPAKSLIQLKDEIRYKWKHSILPVKSKRYSIVFRNG